MSNEIGKRGERIFAFIIGKSFAPYGYLFDTVFLGDKYPTVDFYVDLLNYTAKKGFFFASVKTTTQGYTTEKNHLKIFVNKEIIEVPARKASVKRAASSSELFIHCSNDDNAAGNLR